MMKSGSDHDRIVYLDLMRRYFGILELSLIGRFLEEAAKPKQIQDVIRRATATGNSWDSDEIAESLERQLGRSIRGRPKGRPFKLPQANRKMGTS